jgi:hypothetical protein
MKKGREPLLPAFLRSEGTGRRGAVTTTALDRGERLKKAGFSTA